MGLRSITNELALQVTLFHRRSYRCLVLVPLFVLSVFDGRRPAFGMGSGVLAVALCGLALRAFVVGTAPVLAIGARSRLNSS
jgi:hypothetical protein